MGKSIAAVAGSYLLSVALVVGSDPLLSRLFPGDFARGHVPSTPALAASTALFVVGPIFCAWLCARLAPTRPDRHVLWFFVVGEVLGVAATIPNWSKGWPHCPAAHERGAIPMITGFCGRSSTDSWNTSGRA